MLCFKECRGGCKCEIRSEPKRCIRNHIKASLLNFNMKFNAEEVDDFGSSVIVNQITSPADLLLFKLEIKNGIRSLLIGTTGTFTGSSRFI